MDNVLSSSVCNEAVCGRQSLTWKRALSGAARLRPYAFLASIPFLACGAHPAALCQETAAALTARISDLPEAPTPQASLRGDAGQTASPDQQATISGQVLDASGAAVAGANVSLTRPDGTQMRTAVSAVDGTFSFTKLFPGSYLVTVEAAGFGSYTSTELMVQPQQNLEMPTVSLMVARQTTDVLVRPPEVIAAEQVKAEEKQRILGVVPNFYISYTWDAVPLTTRQKYSLAAHDEFDITTFIGAGVNAGIQQASNSFAGYGQGAAGYGKRYAASFGDSLFANYFSHAVYPSIFHQDPRYFYQGSGSMKSRALHAASFAIITRNDRGQNVPNYSYLLAAATAGAISNLYYPHADRGLNLVFTNAAIGIAGRAGGTILREFLTKRVTTNVSGNGKP